MVLEVKPKKTDYGKMTEEEVCGKNMKKKAALLSDWDDFEDAVQYFTAQSTEVSYIITRNKKDYLSSTITVVEPQEFLKIIENK